MGGSELSLEQEAYLHLLQQQAQAMSHQQLVMALIDSEEARLRQVSVLIGAIHEFGGVVQLTAVDAPCAPDEGEMEEIFGYAPTEDEAWDYLRNLDEMATMDVDLEAVVIDGAIEERDELEELSRWRH